MVAHDCVYARDTSERQAVQLAASLGQRVRMVYLKKVITKLLDIDV